MTFEIEGQILKMILPQKNGYSSLFRRFVIPKVRLIRRFVIPKVRYSEGPLFRRFVNPNMKYGSLIRK